MVFKNGMVYTVDAARTCARALAVKQETIVYVGDEAGLDPLTGPATRVVDLNGGMLLPGFVDSHAHVSGTTNEEAAVYLSNLPSKAACLAAVKDFAARHPELDVIHGAGWAAEIFPPRGPSRKDLDAIVADRPVSLMSEDGHFIWANSRAIQRAGVTADTPSPRGGTIEKDENGIPSGIFRETARDLIVNTLPPFSVDQLKGGIRRFMDEAARVGVTTVHDPLLLLPDADGQLNGFGGLRYNIRAFQELADEQQLRLRVRGTVLTDPTKDISQTDAIAAAAVQAADPLFRITGAKIFVDGVVEGGTAYLFRPYAHRPDFRGEALWESAALNDLFADLDRRGLQIHIHAIGDAALAMSLDALAHAAAATGRRDAQDLITHLQVVDPDDIPRMAQLNVIGVPQPFWHVKGDFHELDTYFLGPERAEKMYPMKSLVDAGVRIAGASDYPVQVPSPPLKAVMLGITRCLPGANGPHGILGPQERLSLEEMIAAYTINGAFANYLETQTGSLEVGKKADLVVLEKNLFEIPAETIADVRVAMTVFNGMVVYENPSPRRMTL